MKKIIIILLVIFGCTARIDAQTLSEAEVVAKMNEAFELNKAKKEAEALCLSYCRKEYGVATYGGRTSNVRV